MDHVLMWDVDKVVQWMISNGFQGYERQLKENGITGDVLINLDHEALKDLSVRTVGERTSILKAIYTLKVSQNIPIFDGDYVPPSTEFENEFCYANGFVDLRKVEMAIQERDTTIQHLVKEITKLSSEFSRLREDLVPIWRLTKDGKSPLPLDPKKSPGHLPPVQRPPRPPDLVLNARSPPVIPSINSAGIENTDPTSPHSPAEQSPAWARRHYPEPLSAGEREDPSDGAIQVYGDKPLASSSTSSSTRDRDRDREPETFKNFRITADDPCYKVLPAVLKKYKISDDWRQYALVIAYGNNQQRCLGYDEKPLVVIQKLKEAKENPVLMLKAIKHVQQPLPTNVE
ncbi:uncharacterized protein VTP21DRAFT_6593 [Calcarisporiella thermophila]|uniref:uncharacterized protein n=1 Tax=Calcarisporiella thermophila TaxID=911321 RepID=UPI00374290CB